MLYRIPDNLYDDDKGYQGVGLAFLHSGRRNSMCVIWMLSHKRILWYGPNFLYVYKYLINSITLITLLCLF